MAQQPNIPQDQNGFGYQPYGNYGSLNGWNDKGFKNTAGDVPYTPGANGSSRLNIPPLTCPVLSTIIRMCGMDEQVKLMASPTKIFVTSELNMNTMPYPVSNHPQRNPELVYSSPLAFIGLPVGG